MKSISLLVVLIAACLCMAVSATNPPPVQVDTIRSWYSVCRKRKLMRANYEDRQSGPLPNNTKSFMGAPRDNSTGYVNWGCVGPAPFRLTGVFQFEEQDFFHFFKTSTSGAGYEFFSAPTMSLTPRDKDYLPLLLPRERGTPVNCILGTTKVGAPRVQNITFVRGTGHEGVWPSSLNLPPHLRRLDNSTNYYRVSLNVSCTLDFAQTQGGFHQYDLSVTSRGTTFTMNKDPIVMHVQEPTVVGVSGCHSSTQYQTFGCSGQGTSSLTITGYGFSQSTLYNRIKFTPLSILSRPALPDCIIQKVEDITTPINTTLKVNISHTKIGYTSAGDLDIDAVPQKITCTFFMFGNPANPVMNEETRPFGEYLVTVVVENTRESRIGVRYGNVDLRPFIDLSRQRVPQIKPIPKKAPLTMVSATICDYPASCYTGRSVSVTARFRPLRATSLENFQKAVKELRFAFTPHTAGVAVPTCITGSTVIAAAGNYTEECYSSLYSAYNQENPFCTLNVTATCTLDVNGVPAGMHMMNVKFNTHPLLDDSKGKDVTVNVDAPVVFRKSETTCSPCSLTDPQLDNRTLIIRGTGFARNVKRNVIKITANKGSSSVVPTCTPFLVNQLPWVSKTTDNSFYGEEIHCKLVEFPDSAKATYGYFTITVESEGRLAQNNTQYFVQPLELDGITGCDLLDGNYNTSLKCSSPEIIDFVGRGIRNQEVTVESKPASALKCLEVNSDFYSVRYTSMQMLPSTDDTKYYSCMLLGAGAGSFSLRLKQRDVVSRWIAVTIVPPSILSISGCSNVSKGAGIMCTGMMNRVDVVVAYPSPIITFNSFTISSSEPGPLPYCQHEGRYNESLPTVDLRQLLKPTVYNNNTILSYFGSWARVTGNLRGSQLLPRPSKYMGRRSNRGPYSFVCYLNTIEATCPARRAAQGLFQIGVRRFGDINTYLGPQIRVPGPSITELDATAACGVRKEYAFSRCDRRLAQAEISLHGYNLDACSAPTPAPMKDSCGNDVSRYFGCSVVFVPVDAAAKSSPGAPACNMSYGFAKPGRVLTSGVSASRIDCTLHYPYGDVAGKWAVGISVQGRTSIPSNLTIDYGTPRQLRLFSQDDSCVERSNTLIECVGMNNPFKILVDSLPAHLQDIKFDPYHDTVAGENERPYCSSYSMTSRPLTMGIGQVEPSSNVYEPSGNITCIVATPTNRTLLGTWRVALKGYSGPDVFVRWVTPAITAMDTKGVCDASGCPYPSVDVSFRGVGLTHGHFDLKAVRSVGDLVPVCVPNVRAWDYISCTMRMEHGGSPNMRPVQGTFYAQMTSAVSWGGPFAQRKSVIRAPEFTSRLPDIVAIQSKNCPVNSANVLECATGTKTELTIIGRFFAPDPSDLKVTVSGVGGAFTCAISNTTTYCNERFHGLACPKLHALNLTNVDADFSTAFHGRYHAQFAEVIKCDITIPEGLTMPGRYSVVVNSAGLETTRVVLPFVAPLRETPVLQTKISKDCFATGNPSGCCLGFVRALAVSAGLQASQGKLVGCTRGSTTIQMTFTSQTSSTTALVQQVSNALSDSSSAVNKAYTILSGLITGATATVDRALGQRSYYACNSKDTDPIKRKKIQDFLATCKVVKVGTATEVQCDGDVEASGCYGNPQNTHTWFRNPSPTVALCQQKTNKKSCVNAREKGELACLWLPASWRCVARDEYSYTSFAV
eukprot:PhM_4_TR9529/c0_g1_i1/m.45965